MAGLWKANELFKLSCPNEVDSCNENLSARTRPPLVTVAHGASRCCGIACAVVLVGILKLAAEPAGAAVGELLLLG